MHLSSQFMLLLVLVGATGELDLDYENDGLWVLRQPIVQPKPRQAVEPVEQTGSLAVPAAKHLDYENDGTWVLRNTESDGLAGYPRPQKGCNIGVEDCLLSVTSGSVNHGDSLLYSVLGMYTPVACLAGRPVFLRLYSPKGQDIVLWWDSRSTAWVISPGVKPQQGAVLALGKSAGKEQLSPQEVLQWIVPANGGTPEHMAAQLKVECTHDTVDTWHAPTGGLPPDDTAAIAAAAAVAAAAAEGVDTLPGKAPQPAAARARQRPAGHKGSSGGKPEQVGATAARRLAGGVALKASSEGEHSTATAAGTLTPAGSNALSSGHEDSRQAGAVDKATEPPARNHFTVTLLAMEALAGVFLAGLAVGWLVSRAKSGRPLAGSAASPHKKLFERRDSVAISPARSSVSWRGARSPQTSHQLPDRPAADRA